MYVKLKAVSHPTGVIVWIGISANGCTKLRFVQHRKDKLEILPRKIRPFLKEDVPRLYPNRDFLFHQDCVPS